jgi:hypothetical protein
VADSSGHELSVLLYQRLLALLGREDVEAGAAIADAVAQTRGRVAAIQHQREAAEQALARLVARRESSLSDISARLRQIRTLGREQDQLLRLLARLHDHAGRLDVRT